ncbi:unknown [Helicoverpa armigera nucleopolyhedrovirus]|uniref:Pif-4 n=2 Tax=Helicoverpa armigera nucleopolyhedrovirus TaxID=51313 RepID=Q99GW3_9ABAC|nr:hypothetical protein HanGV4gp085 [Helicoverpa armigera nucleopolyhedrovirus G4]AAG53828.1 unknown [Helicoverpa armigera nucleopolyhedrovirus G4]
MFLNIASTLIGAVAIVCLLIFFIVLALLNPYRNNVKKLIEDHKRTLQFGAYIDVFDLNTSSAHVERLFLIRPENVVLYNFDGALWYYLESGSVLCPREFAIVRFTFNDIKTVNESGLFNIVCTNVNALTLIEHFMTLKNGLADERIILNLQNINFSIIDVINLLIHKGYVYLE